MKKLADGLIIAALISAVVWIICRMSGCLLPIAGISPKGLYHFTVVLLLFSIAFSLKGK